MYKQVETDKEAVLDNGIKFTPTVTLADEYGGRCQITIDDHCYVITMLNGNTGKYEHTEYIFQEAFDVLKTLPDPKKSHHILETKVCNVYVMNDYNTDLIKLLKKVYDNYNIEEYCEFDKSEEQCYLTLQGFFDFLSEAENSVKIETKATQHNDSINISINIKNSEGQEDKSCIAIQKDLSYEDLSHELYVWLLVKLKTNVLKTKYKPV